MPVINKRKKIPDRIFLGALFDFFGFITARPGIFKNTDLVGWDKRIIWWGKLPGIKLAHDLLAMRFGSFISFIIKEKEFPIGSSEDVTPLLDVLKKYEKKYNIDIRDADVTNWETKI